MAILMRCTVAYHAGDRAVAQGEILSPNDPWFIEQFCVPYEVADPTPAPKPKSVTRKRIR